MQSGKQYDKIVGVTYRYADPDKGDKTALTDGAQSITYMDSRIPLESDDFRAMGR